jgi:prephenate dehydratase
LPPSNPPITVAIQGEAGSFSHAAAARLHGPDVRLLPCPDFEDVFRGVASGAAARGMVPIENTLAGSVRENYDCLGSHALHIVAEIHVRIRHCLIARPGTSLAHVHRVASHPMALAQCRRFFAAHPDVVGVQSYDTAGSVRDLMASRLEADAVIAAALAAETYGADILARDLEDHPENYTRFLAVAREPSPPKPGTAAKISLMFTLADAPGALNRALEALAARGLNLTKIESRPIPGRPWEYMFYVDLLDTPDGSAADALPSLKGHASEFRVLGVYPPATGDEA